MRVLEWLDHPGEDPEQLLGSGCVAHTRSIVGDDLLPVCLLLREERIVFGPRLREHVEV